MKRGFWIVVLMLSTNLIFGQNTYCKATVYMNNGSVKTSNFSFLEELTDKYLYYTDTDEKKPNKVFSDSVRTIVYFQDNNRLIYDRVKVYLGWSQKKYSKRAIWLNRIDSGEVRLYVNYTTLSAPGTMQNGMITSQGGSARFSDYYVIRANEPAAKIYATISSFNNNQTFKAKAPLYFADYPALVEKIKNKEYTWKNLMEVVKIYNEWAHNNRK